MRPWPRVSLLSPLLFGLLGCATPDSVELGATCKQSVECKAPADTCVNVVGEQLCTMACSATEACPEEYACARMDVRVEGADGAGKADAQGYCLAKARLGPAVATIAPKKDGKAGKKRRRKRKRKMGRGKRKRDQDVEQPSPDETKDE